MAIKQVIVIRKDLNMRKGKMVSQSGHASMKVFFDKMKHLAYSFRDGNDNHQMFETRFTPEMMSWLEWEEGKPGFTKICVSCDSEEELRAIKNAADAAGVVNALIVDNGVTEFHGVPTPTCICLGPDEAEKIDPITGSLKLL